MKHVKAILEIWGTGLFVGGIIYIWIHRYSTPMNITHFAALEYCGLYLYIIIERIYKKQS
jgi:hypothetical protein